MSNKFKLISTISAMCMVLVLLTVGVWAVSTATLTLGGSVSFSAENVHATVAGAISGTVDPVNIETLQFDVGTNMESEEFQDKLDSWTQNLSFTPANNIQITITVTNLSTERDLYVKVTDLKDVTNLKKTPDFTSGEEYKIEKGTESVKNSKTFTIGLKVDSMDKSVNGSYEYKVDLRDEKAGGEEEVEPLVLDSNKEAEGMTFALSTDGSNTAVLQYANPNNYSEVSIPERVQYGADIYVVTRIECGAFGMCEYSVVEFPSTISALGEYIFERYNYRTDSLVTIIFNSVEPPVFDRVDDEDGSLNYEDGWFNFISIYVPADSVDAYKTAEGWSYYSDKIAAIA